MVVELVITDSRREECRMAVGSEEVRGGPGGRGGSGEAGGGGRVDSRCDEVEETRELADETESRLIEEEGRRREGDLGVGGVRAARPYG